MVGKVLGHKQTKTTEIYAHLADDPIRAVANSAATRISNAMKSKQQGTTPDVAQLPRCQS
jgi:hypothetical protein